MQVDRPSTKSQPSRKGKRAWRKNVDLDDIEQALEEKREELIQHGETLDNLDSEDLFFIDEEVDDKIIKRLKKDPVKVLKSTEILNARSKVPALTTERNNKKKIQGVNKKEIRKLMKLAGKVQGVDRTQALIEDQGIINSKAYDVWGEDEPGVKIVKKPEILEKYSGISYTPATKVPKTLTLAPVKIREQEKLPHAGKSYNPSYDSWKQLINQEYFKEKTKDDQRIALEEHQERIQYLVENLDTKEFDDTDHEEAEAEEEGEEEEEEEEEEGKEGDKFRVSVNPVVKIKKKTKSQRNKQKKHQERVKLEQELKELKYRIKELETLPDQLPSEPEAPKRLTKEQSEALKLKKEKKKLGTKHNVMEQAMEVKLSDELNDSLRKLKPEGNLLYDHMRKLQDSGKIEVRKPIKQKKKYKAKVTEKWTYKDFK